VLDGVDLELAACTLTDIVGPSGAGKTMLLRSLARLIPQANGQLTLDGRSAEEFPPQEWRTRVALLPQTAAMRPGSVRENLLLPWTLKVRHADDAPSDDALRRALDGVGLDVALDRDTARLSVGQAARIALLRVLLTGPLVLLLDEPDAALDEASTEQVARATLAFVDAGGTAARVRHRASDGLASRRLRLAGGKLEEL
jgi:putative ABC transport system ATP-binding protein